MFIFNLILLVWLCFYFLLINNSAAQDDKCYYSNYQTGETWKLVWQDQFESDHLSNWNVDHETEQDECQRTGYFVNQTNCNRRENVWTSNGLLVMMASQEKYANHNFTGASITTEQYFAYGRYEIRAMVPTEQYISVLIQTHNDNDQYWTESGQINILNVDSDLINNRGFYHNGSRLHGENGIRDSITLSKQSKLFHRYGVEWDVGKIQFFFNDIYGETILLNDTFQVKPWQHLKLEIFVKEAENAIKMNWKCPAIFVDYIRVYKKVQLDYLKFNEKEIKNKQCTDNSQLQEQEIVAKKICAEASVGKRFKSERKTESKQSTQIENLLNSNNYWVYATIAMLIIIAVLVAYRVFVPRKVTKAKTNPQNEYHVYAEIAENKIY